VRRAWPALAHALGAELEPRFDAYARASPPPDGGAAADGLAFAEALRREGRHLPGEARVERALVRARFRLRDSRLAPRRLPFVAIVVADRRLVLVASAGSRRLRTLTVRV
jgi:hypothetical protein